MSNKEAVYERVADYVRRQGGHPQRDIGLKMVNDRGAAEVTIIVKGKAITGKGDSVLNAYLDLGDKLHLGAAT